MADEQTPEELARYIRMAVDRSTPPRSVEQALIAAALSHDRAWPSSADPMLRAAKALRTDRGARLVHVIVRLIGKTLELMEPRGEQLTPVTVRGTSAGGVMLRRQVGTRDVTAHVATTPAQRFLVSLDIWSQTAEQTSRVTLYRDDRELMSEVPRHGRVLLPTLDAGHYHVVLSEAGRIVGELDLTFERTAA